MTSVEHHGHMTATEVLQRRKDFDDFHKAIAETPTIILNYLITCGSDSVRASCEYELSKRELINHLCDRTFNALSKLGVQI